MYGVLIGLDLSALLLFFIPLFVAIDAPGVLPIFLSLTEGLDKKQKRKLITEATLTALAVSLVFLIGGQVIFSFLGITENDFRVGGGIVLLVLSVNDLLFSHKRQRDPESTVGVVPIGIPLIMGPAALTAILILVDLQGYLPTIISLAANPLIVWLVFRYADVVTKVVGQAGSKRLPNRFLT